MKTSEPRSPLAFSLVADLVIARGQAPMTQYDAPLHVPIDDRWEGWINGSDEDSVIADAATSSMAHEATVPPFSFMAFRLGWLAGIIDPGGGTVIGSSEDELVAALEAAIEGVPAQ